MVLEARKKKKEQVQNTQTLKSRGKGCKKKKLVVSRIWIVWLANWRKTIDERGTIFHLCYLPLRKISY